ncbi:MAG TPA: hypothetical protein VF712_10280 [Thermoleophilaceae bacterium]|jgi:hypothetical protein
MSELPAMHVFGLERFEFPGRAGELQAAGAVPAMVRELGDNYAPYHGELAARLAKTGGQPDPGDFGDDFDGYAEACTRVLDVVRAEAFLRRCRSYRRDGTPLDADLSDSPPLVDESQRLVSVETGRGAGPPVKAPAAPVEMPPPPE